MKTIWKYEINIPYQRLMIPKGGKVLTFQRQHESRCLWIEVDTETELEERVFIAFGTGHPILGTENLTYIGSIQEHNGALIWHLFEEVQHGTIHQP